LLVASDALWWAVTLEIAATAIGIEFICTGLKR
jgi:hypothetical protein